MNKYIAILCVLCALLSGCEITRDSYLGTNNLQGIKADRLFTTGEKAMVRHDYQTAAKYFEALDSQYPFSHYTEQMILNLMYCYHQVGDHAAAAATAERYIHLYPRADRVDYAYYMKGIAEFDQERTTVMRHLPVDVALRDLTLSHQSYDNFATFIRRFPSSRYAADARQRMIYLRNIFAKKELRTAEFYYRSKAYVAAANRASYIVEQYNQSPQVAPALALLVKANRKLGLENEAQEALAVLQRNFPKYHIRGQH